MHTFRPQATSNTLWAMAKLGYVPPVDTLEAAATQILADMRASVPQDVSNSLWAFASMRHHPGTPLLDAAAIQSTITATRFKPQEVANTLWAFATLGHDPGATALDALAAQAAGLAYHYLPVISGQVTAEQVAAFAAVVADSKGPVLAFCRSGARSTNMWRMGL